MQMPLPLWSGQLSDIWVETGADNCSQQLLIRCIIHTVKHLTLTKAVSYIDMQNIKQTLNNNQTVRNQLDETINTAAAVLVTTVAIKIINSTCLWAWLSYVGDKISGVSTRISVAFRCFWIWIREKIHLIQQLSELASESIQHLQVHTDTQITDMCHAYRYQWNVWYAVLQFSFLSFEMNLFVGN